MSEFEEFKRKEYLGEIILTFYVRMILFKKNCDRVISREIEFDLLSNKNLTKIAIALSVKENENDKSAYSDKKIASALECMVYEKYIKEKSECVRFIKEIINVYFKINPKNYIYFLSLVNKN